MKVDKWMVTIGAQHHREAFKPLDACGPVQGTNSNKTPNTREVYSGSESAGDKLRRREGDSPDRRLRSQSVC